MNSREHCPLDRAGRCTYELNSYDGMHKPQAVSHATKSQPGEDRGTWSPTPSGGTIGD